MAFFTKMLDPVEAGGEVWFLAIVVRSLLASEQVMSLANWNVADEDCAGRSLTNRLKRRGLRQEP